MARGLCRWVVFALAAAPLLVGAQPAGAAVDKAGADVTGCKGTATSKDKDGGTVDTVAAPGPPGSSKDNAFVVDYDGRVAYDGSSDNVITDHHWEVRVFGAPVKSGGSKNTSRKTTSADTVKVSDYLPFKAPGVYYVSGDLKGTGGSCEGNIWVKVSGSPVGTLPWIGGIVLAAGGLLLLFFALPTASAVAVGAVGAPGPEAGAGGGHGASGGFSGGAPLGEPPAEPAGPTPPEA